MRLILHKLQFWNHKDSFSDNELNKLLMDTKKGDQGAAWFDKCKKAFCSVLTTKPDQAKGGGK